ncbi:hypothetical protein [Schaalia canis]|uniref:Uncharacterized protein n=1 Tax=Schaalia canis TaxID=100469 RepID=A0A3P1SES9_9ACTO|nr:hypothetical protein [Schaalia canis]RRC95526.1 hypothetical protein EII11_04430 [Schaalia canis]
MNLNRKARFATLAAGLAAVFTLSACAGNPGTAMSVGDTTYSNTDISTGVAQISEIAGRPVDTPVLVNAISRASLITEFAKQNNITVADSEIEDFAKAQVAAGAFAAFPEGELSAVTRDFLRLQMLTDKLSAVITDPAQIEAANAQYAELVQNTDIEVNPRYGTFDEETDLLAPSTFGDVVSSHTHGAR